MTEELVDADGPDDRPPRPAMSRDDVVQAAIAVIDECGVDGLTMRQLGAALSADPMAAYAHFRNRAELLDAVVEHQAARVFDIPPLDDGDLVELMIGLALHYRAMLREHPNLAPLLASRPLPQATAPDSIVDSVALLRHAGFADEDVPVVFDALVTFAFGFVLQEALRSKRRELLGVAFEEQQEDILRALAERPDDTTVAEAAIRRRLAPGAAEEEFTTGLRAMLLGLRAGLGRAPGADPG